MRVTVPRNVKSGPLDAGAGARPELSGAAEAVAALRDVVSALLDAGGDATLLELGVSASSRTPAGAWSETGVQAVAHAIKREARQKEGFISGTSQHYLNRL